MRPFYPDGTPMYYDREGVPFENMEDVYQKLGDLEYKRVAQDTIGPYWISTVWLGLDHRLGGQGPPLIFETMVFLQVEGEDSIGEDMDCLRYSTEAEALKGHNEMVTLIRSTVDLEPPTERPRNARTDNESD